MLDLTLDSVTNLRYFRVGRKDPWRRRLPGLQSCGSPELPDGRAAPRGCLRQSVGPSPLGQRVSSSPKPCPEWGGHSRAQGPRGGPRGRSVGPAGWGAEPGALEMQWQGSAARLGWRQPPGLGQGPRQHRGPNRPRSQPASSAAARQPSPSLAAGILRFPRLCCVVRACTCAGEGRGEGDGGEEESGKPSVVEDFLINGKRCWCWHGGGAGCPARGQSPAMQGSVLTDPEADVWNGR